MGKHGRLAAGAAVGAFALVAAVVAVVIANGGDGGPSISGAIDLVGCMAPAKAIVITARPVHFVSATPAQVASTTTSTTSSTTTSTSTTTTSTTTTAST